MVAAQDSPPVHEQLQQCWQACLERWEPLAEGRKQRKFRALLLMGVLLEGDPTGPHGRALRSSQTAKQQ
jgi:hypothetical protein